jgi:predicted amidohydrolase YtcJ
MLVFSAADFENFLEPRPDLVPEMESELHRLVKPLAEHRRPFRLHATFDESIARFFDDMVTGAKRGIAEAATSASARRSHSSVRNER